MHEKLEKALFVLKVRIVCKKSCANVLLANTKFMVNTRKF